MANVTEAQRSFAELTRAYFGRALNMDEVFALVELVELPHRVPQPSPECAEALWVGSVGYERHRDSQEFARRLREAGVERLVDVRELPISRRRGYAKSALSIAMAEVGIEYVHVKALGNPKPYRDLYKSGNVDEGRRSYRRHLLSERREALDDLVDLLREKRTALMCVEDDPAVCHRTVIVEELRAAVGLELEVAQLP